MQVIVKRTTSVTVRKERISWTLSSGSLSNTPDFNLGGRGGAAIDEELEDRFVVLVFFTGVV